MRLFYCPKCYKEEIKNGYPSRSEITYKNIRDGYGRPITHYRCECGNLLAGSIDIAGFEDDKDAVSYYKGIIEGYNKDGIYYRSGLYEKIKEMYEEELKLQF